MTADALVEATVVTPDAGVVRASADSEHSDLLRALKGGGGNFGVVTFFTFALFPVPRGFALSSCTWRFPLPSSVAEGGEAGGAAGDGDAAVAAAASLFQGYSSACAAAPQHMSAFAFADQHTLTVMTVDSRGCRQSPTDGAAGQQQHQEAEAAAVGAKESVADVIALFNQHMPRPADEVHLQEKSYEDLCSMFDEGSRHGGGYRWSRSTLVPAPGLDDHAANAMARFLVRECSASQRLTLELMHLGGAVLACGAGEDEDGGGGAYLNREAVLEFHCIAAWDVQAGGRTVASGKAKAAAATITAYNAAIPSLFGEGSAGYGNVDGGDGFDDARLLSVFGKEGLARLRRVKSRYDGSNFLHYNHNISPAADASGQLQPHYSELYQAVIDSPIPVNTSDSGDHGAESRGGSGSGGSGNGNIGVEPDVEHEGIGCDMCRVFPVRGVRWKCAMCPDYDLCSACEPVGCNRHPSSHVFLKIRRPVTVPAEDTRKAFVPPLYAAEAPQRGSSINRLDGDSAGSGRGAVARIGGEMKKFLGGLAGALNNGRGALRSVSASSIRDNSGALKRIHSPDGKLLSGATLSETLKNALEYFGDRPCLGCRRPQGRPQGTGADQAGLYAYMTYGEVLAQATARAAGLRRLVAASCAADGARPLVAICANTSVDWILADLACVLEGLGSVCIPAQSLAAQATLHGMLNTARVPVVLCETSMVASFESARGHCSNLACVCPIGKLATAAVGSQQSRNKRAQPPPFADVFSVMYTSGSAGAPKGVVRTRASWHSLLASHLQGTSGASYADRPAVLSYAPLEHIMDRSLVWLTLMQGGQVAVFDGPIGAMLDDARVVRPTLLGATPALWNTVYAEYKQRLAAGSPDEAVLAGMRGWLGGRTDVLVTGGAPTSAAVIDFLKRCFRCEVNDGYGATETGPILTDGKPQPGVEVKLLAVPELGYSPDDQPRPRGELLVRTATMADGYLLASDTTGVAGADSGDAATAALLGSDGWYHSGDVCQLERDGRISVIDRRSSIFKNSTGEFVAPERVEAACLSARGVRQAWVHGDASKSGLVAVLVLDPDASATAGEHEARVLRDIQQCAANAGLSSHELPRVVVAADEPFTSENGLLTPSRKLSRARLRAAYRQRLQAAFDGIESRVDQVMALVRQASPALQDPQQGSAEAASENLTASGTLTLAELGGDSTAALRLVSQLRDVFGVNLEASTLLQCTVQDMLALLENGDEAAAQGSAGDRGASGRVDDPTSGMSDAECARHDMLFTLAAHHDAGAGISGTSAEARPGAAGMGPRHMLLTGATGFLGVHLLVELLSATAAVVHCLVRTKRAAATPSGALGRLATAVQEFGLPPADAAAFDAAVAAGRVVPVLGDLALPHFGLDRDKWAALRCSVDGVIHNGALVNWLCDYKTARGPNVLGTQTVLELCAAGPGPAALPLHLHFISTISTAADGGKALEKHGGSSGGLTAASLDGWLRRGAGYVASKHVAEAVARRVCAQRRVPLCVYRPGMVSLHSASGRANPTDYVTRVLAAMVQLRATVASPERIDVTAVDYVARAVVALALQPASVSASASRASHEVEVPTPTYHLVNPHPPSYDELGALLNASRAGGDGDERGGGGAYVALPFAQLLQRAAEAPKCALRPLLGYLQNTGLVCTPAYACTATATALARVGVGECPRVDSRLIGLAAATTANKGPVLSTTGF
jgi:fatty acid CoA ligase FadD9